MDEMIRLPEASGVSTLGSVTSSNTWIFSADGGIQKTPMSIIWSQPRVRKEEDRDSLGNNYVFSNRGSSSDAAPAARAQCVAFYVNIIKSLGSLFGAEWHNPTTDIIQSDLDYGGSGSHTVYTIQKPEVMETRRATSFCNDLEQGINFSGGRNMQQTHQDSAALSMGYPSVRKFLVIMFTLLTVSSIVASCFGIARGERQQDMVTAKRWVLAGTAMVMVFTFCAMTAAGRQLAESISMVMVPATIGMGLLGELEHLLRSEFLQR